MVLKRSIAQIVQLVRHMHDWDVLNVNNYKQQVMCWVAGVLLLVLLVCLGAIEYNQIKIESVILF